MHGSSCENTMTGSCDNLEALTEDSRFPMYYPIYYHLYRIKQLILLVTRLSMVEATVNLIFNVWLYYQKCLSFYYNVDKWEFVKFTPFLKSLHVSNQIQSTIIKKKVLTNSINKPILKANILSASNTAIINPLKTPRLWETIIEVDAELNNLRCYANLAKWPPFSGQWLLPN